MCGEGDNSSKSFSLTFRILSDSEGFHMLVVGRTNLGFLIVNVINRILYTNQPKWFGS